MNVLEKILEEKEIVAIKELIEANKKEVVAWQPFPEPYKEE